MDLRVAADELAALLERFERALPGRRPRVWTGPHTPTRVDPDGTLRDIHGHVVGRMPGPPRRHPALRRKLTDAEFVARQERVSRVVDDARATLATHVTHGGGVTTGGTWSPERDAIHREIAGMVYADAITRGVPAEGRALLAGGLPGAGKSTALRDHVGIDLDRWLVLSSDDIKEELARRGLVPDIPGHPDLSPMERSLLVHWESSRIVALIADMAYRDRRNIVWDFTMADPTRTEKLITSLREYGYGDVAAMFVDIPTELSVTRALARWRLGQDEYLTTGRGIGGRWLPPRTIRVLARPDGGTIPREGFDRIRHLFDRWVLLDNSTDGQPPRVVDRSGQ